MYLKYVRISDQCVRYFSSYIQSSRLSGTTLVLQTINERFFIKKPSPLTVFSSIYQHSACTKILASPIYVPFAYVAANYRLSMVLSYFRQMQKDVETKIIVILLFCIRFETKTKLRLSIFHPTTFALN